MTRTLRGAALAAALLAAAAAPGCGDAETLYDIKGTVTYGGRPVPKGLIFFDPAAGTPGTQGFANIENGRFDTAAAGQGKGVRGGRYDIRVSGFDGVEGPEAPFGQFLFPEHAFTRDLPAADQTLDYDVPATAKKKGR